MMLSTTVIRIKDAASYLRSMLPVAGSYWRQHGTFSLLKRSVEVLFERSQGGSVAYASRWVRTDDPRMVVSASPSHYLAHGCVAIIGALELEQCKKYRVLQKIEQLQQTYNLQVVVSSYQDVQRGFDILQLATALVLYRVPYGEFFTEYVREARRLRIPVLYDIDDPIFDEHVFKSNSNLEVLSRVERDHLTSQCSLYLRAARSVDACIASTPRLRDLLAERTNKMVYLWRNAIDAESDSIARSVLSNFGALATDGSLTIGYMSGSRAHDLDFGHVSNAIEFILDKYPSIKLLVKGHATMPLNLLRFGSRVECLEFSNYFDYFDTLSRCDIIVVPLLTDDFNACKSAIRYMEAGLVGKPCVMSAVGDVVNLATHNKNVLFARNTDEWVACLQQLIVNDDDRRRIGASAHEFLTGTLFSENVASMLDSKLVSMLSGKNEV